MKARAKKRSAKTTATNETTKFLQNIDAEHKPTHTHRSVCV